MLLNLMKIVSKLKNIEEGPINKAIFRKYPHTFTTLAHFSLMAGGFNTKIAWHVNLLRKPVDNRVIN